MGQRLIVIHGRSTKPAQGEHRKLLRKALVGGVKRYSAAKAKQITSGKVKIDYVYYGDINNALLSKTAKHKKTLTAKDPDKNNARCLPSAALDQAIDRLLAIKRYDKAAYKKILRQYEDSRWLDDAAAALSTIAAITSATLLNEKVISLATADMGAYLLTRKTGSAVRTRLQEPLARAITGGHDICLVSHSMGCMVSYDVLWKFSRMSEYRKIQNAKNPVTRWITLGCPLGEAGVKKNLYDGDERGEDRYPAHIVKDWLNFSAKDDFICHDATMRDDYRKMKRYGFVDSITDKGIYNCFAVGGASNPHKFYGYLANAAVGGAIADWIK